MIVSGGNALNNPAILQKVIKSKQRASSGMDYTTQYSTEHVKPERRQSARSFLDTKPVCPSHYSWLSNTKLSLYVTVSAAIFHDSVQSHHDQRSLCVVRTIEPNTSARSKLRVHRVLPSGKQGIQDIKLWYSSHKVSHVISSSHRLSSLISFPH